MPRQREGIWGTCQECATEIWLSPSQIERRKFCSRACQDIVIERRRRTVCARCGTPFGQSPSISGKYCSMACYRAGRLKHETCVVCSVPLKVHQLLYCSPQCMGAGRLTLEERPCEACHRPMKVQPHLFGKKRACSKMCNDELKRLQGPGARFLRKDGYVAIYYPKHPNAASDGRVMEHRLVMEKKLGRLLLKTETVNHINHIRDDNRPENLEILSPGDHARESTAFGKALRLTQRQKLAAYEAKYGPLME